MHKRTTMVLSACAALFALWLAATPALAQIQQPVVSPYATTSEQIGITDVTVTYGRPAVNGRQIWGALVPYGLTQPFPNFGSGNPFPWRAGANENTTVTFEHDMLVEGRPLAAGTYGLHMIAAENGPWTVIFSNNATSWGSFFYDEAEDALRVQVTPRAAPHTERLRYEFTDHEGRDAAHLTLRWEELAVPIGLQVADMHATVMEQAALDLRSRAGFGAQGYTQAATYAMQNNVNHEQALAWADIAMQRNPGFATTAVKAGLLTQLGRTDEADALVAGALPTATENELNAYGYQLAGAGRHDEAMRIFKLNVERHPDAWNPHDSLGEAYANQGDKEMARKYYQMALDKLPPNLPQQRDRINQILAQLGGV